MGLRGTHRRRRSAALAALVCGLPLLATVTARAGVTPGVRTGGVAPGPVTGVRVQGDTVTIDALRAQVQVIFYTDDLFRIWTAPLGEKFTDPANSPPEREGAPAADVVVKHDYPGVTPRVTDDGPYRVLSTRALALRVYTGDLRFALYRPDNRTLVWEELVGPTWDGRQTTDVLARGATEQFFGGGMQNGRFSHRDQTIKVGVSYDWNDGGFPNSAPFYVSTAGYGVLRNTLAPGSYAFTAPVLTSHEENRFDAYYFLGDLKQVIDRYTELTGRPFLPPIYGLEMGDADCYLHSVRHGEIHTLDALGVADDYVKNQIPLGWMLVNDGYSCGYEYLDQVAAGLNERNMQLGLWTSTGLGSHAAEVKAGVRVRKLDIGWVGPGYRAALSACDEAYQGMERDTDIRGFVWLPEGWAGSQRCGVHWSGDQKGNWDTIRWQIPTYAGSTMSGQAYTTSDLDGIYDG
ncbi:MAG: DUF4968 domain-containing protein, partial [Actinobacteria bacterium]|nr:DUF4968 domain-containing protein [Actinomycetota bacterium]